VINGIMDHRKGEKTVGVKNIGREIEGLPTVERSILITQLMFGPCQEILGEDECRDQLRELLGIDCLEKLRKRLETGM
jgi:hypothetical protein